MLLWVAYGAIFKIHLLRDLHTYKELCEDMETQESLDKSVWKCATEFLERFQGHQDREAVYGRHNFSLSMTASFKVGNFIIIYLSN